MPTASSSSSLLHSSRPPPVPVVLRGPEKDSRRYITELPRTLDGLLLKARSLFPVPPGNTPYITLDTDTANAAEQTVILEDAIPFIREREVLVFRWSPDTPRKCSGHRVKWDASVSTGPAPPSTSPPSRRPPFSQVHNSQTPRATPTQIHRAAHVRRVLEEQRRQRDVEQAEAEEEQRRSEAAVAAPQREKQEAEQGQKAQDDADQAMAVEQEPQQSEQGTLNPSDSSPAKEPTARPSPTTDVAQSAPCEPLFSASSMTAADLEVSGSSPPPYSSPHGPPPATVAVTTEPTTAPRFTTPEHDSGSDEPLSSPLVSSPTRDVHAAVLKTSMSPHNGDKLVAGRSPSSGGGQQEQADGEGVATVREEEQAGDEYVAPVHDEKQADSGSVAMIHEEEQADGGDVASAHTPPQQIAEPDDTADADSDEELERSALLQSSPPSTTVLQESDEDTAGDTSMESTTSFESASEDIAPQHTDDKLHRTMKAVIQNLKNHPANNALRDSMPADFHAFAQDGADDMQGGSGAIDLHIISSRVASGEYSDGMHHFRGDLRRMWTLTRDFYGPTSAQGKCATILERFAEVVLNEWKGRVGGGERPVTVATTNKRKSSGSGDSTARQRAAALMASWSQGNGQNDSGPPPRYNKKQRKSGGSATTPSGFKWPDMMAFHRAIMGGDVKVQEKQQDVVEELLPPVVAPLPVEQPQAVSTGEEVLDAGSDLSSAPPTPDRVAPVTGGTIFSSSKPKPTTSTPAKRGRRGNGRARKAGGAVEVTPAMEPSRRSARGRVSAVSVE